MIKIITIFWPCFHGKASRIKDFYLRWVGFLTTVETKSIDSINTKNIDNIEYSQIENILYSILIVAFSECDDIDTECANKQEFLLQTIIIILQLMS